MKRLAIVLAAVMIFTLAWSTAQSQAELNKQYQKYAETNNHVEKEQKPKQSKPKATKDVVKATPDTPKQANTPKVDKTPIKTPKASENAPKQAKTTYSVGCDQYRHIVEQYSWPTNVAMAVMQAESSCNPNAALWSDNHMSWAGCMGSFGLFQINCSHGQLYDPEKNIAQAYRMYQASGWQPWSAYTTGAYLKYLQ